MGLELFKDGLGIKISFMDANKVLSHVSLEFVFKDIVDKLLLFGEDSKLISSVGMVVRVKYFFTGMRTRGGKGGTTQTIPLFDFFEEVVVGFVPLDSFAKVLKDGRSWGRLRDHIWGWCR